MFDVVIIGGGISGGSAALYTAQGKLKTAVFDTGKSQILRVSKLANYPGIKDISGADLVATIEEQARENGAEWMKDEIVEMHREGDVYTLQTASGKTVKGKYVVIATNLNVQLLEKLGLEIAVNEKVPSGKIKKVVNLQENGRTELENVYVTGLLAGVPSQVVSAAGHGTDVAVEIVSKETEKTYMWHDV